MASLRILRLLDFDAIKLYTMPVKRDQGQQRKRKAGAQEDAEASSVVWSVPFFGWLVRVTPKPTEGKIRTAQAILLQRFPKVLSVDSLTTGVCLTLGERRNKHAVARNIHNLLGSVFPKCTLELTPTDGATAPLTVAELKYKGLSEVFGQHFDKDVRLIQVGRDGSPFYFNGAVLHVNTDHKDVASLLVLEGSAQSCAIRYFRLGLNAVGASLPGLPTLPTLPDFGEVLGAAGGGSKATDQNHDDSHPVVDHHRGSNSPEGTAEHEPDGHKKLLLQLKRWHWESIRSGRKRWEARPLVEKRKGGKIAPWRYRNLATEGRMVTFQSGPPPTLVMRIAEVRIFEPNDCSSIPPAEAMVMELGTDLLPDVADANARVREYRKLYGSDICAHGFVAMRVEKADEMKAADESATRVLEDPGVRRPRTCDSPRRCGSIGCDDCYPPGDPYQNRRKGSRRARLNFVGSDAASPSRWRSA